ncbi:tetratricopeptide repeat protein [Phragmitibacter flavus]|uniref:tetratricopeptide repeat protein n=1 Tax=Phragmitibacter flavus TaxID=2576071 RepID=UPI0019824E7A|nr:hypothetical protein [Phragmitibacter flavus]
MFEKAVSSASQVFKDTDIEMTVRRAELAEAYRIESRWTEAIVHFDYAWKRSRADAIALNRWEEQEGDLSMGCAVKLSQCYQAIGNHDKVIEVAKMALDDNALHRRRLPERAQYLVLLADSYLFQKREKEASDAAKEASEIAELTLVEDPRQSASVCFVLGKVYLDHQRQDEARKMLHRAVELATQHMPPSDNERAQMQRELAVVQIKDGKLKEAEQLLEQTLEQLSKNAVPDKQTLLACHLSLASIELRKEDPKDAFVHTAEVRRLCEQNGWEDRYENGRSYLLSGLTHAKLKQPVLARHDLEFAQDIFERLLGTEHPDVLIIKKALSDMLKKQNQPPQPAASGVDIEKKTTKK